MGAAFLGGLLIGLASLLLLAYNGRVCGISGILGGLIRMPSQENRWQLAFVLGLFAGGLGFAWFNPEALRNELVRSTYALVAAGLLVGFGTRLGGGCTSGHGVCGIGRFSVRSVVATLVFMAVGAIVVFVVHRSFGGFV